MQRFPAGLSASPAVLLCPSAFRLDETTASCASHGMGGIELFSPPSSPALGRYSLTSTRWRPSLLTTACCLANLFVFVLYHHHFTSSQPTQPQDVQLEVLRDDVPTANSSAAVTPPSRALSCEVCHLDPSNPLCEYGYSAIRQSRAYEGSGTRLRRVLQKALRGEAIQVGVLGASVTQGHGVIPPYQRWEDRWFEDFQHIFPSAVIHVGAVPAAGSQFFSYCFGSVVSTDLDLYFVELDINNDVSFDTMQEDDSLMRGLLGLPQQPAVIRLSVFALLFEELARGSTSSLSTSQFFDVPVISCVTVSPLSCCAVAQSLTLERQHPKFSPSVCHQTSGGSRRAVLANVVGRAGLCASAGLSSSRDTL